MDVIFSSGTRSRVDDLVRARAEGQRAGLIGLTPVEEMIWSKAFIQERERFDGADVRTCCARPTVARLAAPADAIRRLLARAAQPSDPVWLRLSRSAPEHSELGQRRAAAAADGEPSNLQNDICYGTLSREQYRTTSSTGNATTPASSRRPMTRERSGGPSNQRKGQALRIGDLAIVIGDGSQIARSPISDPPIGLPDRRSGERHWKVRSLSEV
jgi:hypothetical protein